MWPLESGRPQESPLGTLELDHFNNFRDIHRVHPPSRLERGALQRQTQCNNDADLARGKPSSEEAEEGKGGEEEAAVREEAAVLTRELITKEDPPNAHQVQHGRKPWLDECEAPGHP